MWRRGHGGMKRQHYGTSFCMPMGARQQAPLCRVGTESGVRSVSTTTLITPHPHPLNFIHALHPTSQTPTPAQTPQQSEALSSGAHPPAPKQRLHWGLFQSYSHFLFAHIWGKCSHTGSLNSPVGWLRSMCQMLQL